MMKINSRGKKHVLLRSVYPGLCSGQVEVNQMVKDGGTWSAPLTLDDSCYWKHACSLSVGDSGAGFAAWVNEEQKFVGR